MMLDKMLDRLPDLYNKNEGSGIYNIIKLAADQLAAGEKTLEKIHDWRDIDQAEGSTLDKLGKDVDQPRGGFEDEEYRQKIKIKIRANLSGGEIETLNSICVVLLGDRFNGIQEGWDLPAGHPIGPKPAMMLFTVRADGINYGLPMAEIDNVAAGGVADNWELLVESSFDIEKTIYQSWEAPYKMTNEHTTSTEQQQGPITEVGLEVESRYYTAMNDFKMPGEQQNSLFYNDQAEVSINYLVSLHNLQMAGTSRAGEGVVL